MNRKCLLIVDDEKAYVRSLAFALKKDFETITAYSYEESVKILKKGNVHGALLDVRLDEHDETNKDGLLILDLINKNYKDIKVFVMTSYKDMGFQEEAMKLGAKHFFEKPIDIIQMRRILKEKMD